MLSLTAVLSWSIVPPMLFHAEWTKRDVPLAVRRPQVSEVDRLRWLTGCWQNRVGQTVTDEQWMAPAGQAMIGMSRTVSNERLRAWEALRIVTDSGRLVYVAQPQGGAATRFVATAISDTLAVFENLAHDFPQRIAYARVRADSVVARISAVKDGRERGMAIPMGRRVCAP
ncbi:DUF6265 family protein [Gemmatimonas sp.]